LAIMAGFGMAGLVELFYKKSGFSEIGRIVAAAFFDFAMLSMGVVAQMLLVRLPRKAQQQERQQARQRLEQLQLGGQRQEQELARELSGEQAREMAKERDPQKALLSTQQGEKAWKKVMDAAMEAVDDFIELISLARSNDLERASPLIQRRREEARREAVDVVRDAVDTALGLAFNTPEDNNVARTGFILNRAAQHVCSELREVMLQSANPISRMLSPTELDIWQSTIVQTIQNMFFDMWYVQ